MNRWMNEQTNEPTNNRTNEGANERTSERINQRLFKKTDRQTNKIVICYRNHPPTSQWMQITLFHIKKLVLYINLHSARTDLRRQNVTSIKSIPAVQGLIAK